jgi:hypothetical protein
MTPEITTALAHDRVVDITTTGRRTGASRQSSPSRSKTPG